MTLPTSLLPSYNYKASCYRFRLVILWLVSCFILFPHNQSIHPIGAPFQEAAPTPAPAQCMAILLANTERDIHNSILAIESFDKYIKDNNTTPILIFQEGDLSSETRQRVVNVSNDREILFPYVDFSSYPPGFDPSSETNKLNFRKRSAWGYQQMCRFWITRLWTHDAVREKNCESIMRMDADSCFLKKTDVGDTLPGLKSHDEVYRANKILADNSASFVEGLMQLTQLYIETNDLKPRNNYLWEKAIRSFEASGGLPSFGTNFEISRVSFFAREEVMDYQMAVADHEPFGVFRQRWGDAPVRFLTLALFAEPSMIDYNVPFAYGHGDRKCPDIHRVPGEGF